jgi:hypothetical protein
MVFSLQRKEINLKLGKEFAIIFKRLKKSSIYAATSAKTIIFAADYRKYYQIPKGICSIDYL